MEPRDSTSPREVPVALLSQALIEFRAIRGNRQAEKEVALRYINNGVANGYQIGPLLEWLFFWPNSRESVFWQARLDAKFVDMLKKLSTRDLELKRNGPGAADGEKPSPEQTGGQEPAVGGPAVH